MRTRRDQVQAYRFVTRRIVSAVLSGEPEAAERPMRRLALSVFASSMVAALVIAGVGVWGLVTGRNSDVEGDALIVADDTEARYVLVGGQLYPVANIASARLILGTDDPPIRRLSRAALGELPQGPLVGIPLAPDDPPSADDLLGLPWRVCSVPPSAQSPEARTIVVVGEQLGGAQVLGENRALLVAGEAEYVLLDDRALRLTGIPGEIDNIKLTLDLSAVTPAPVTTQLLNAMTAGPDLEIIRPEGFGEPANVPYELGGRQPLIGFLYQAGNQHYVMTDEGLVPIGDVALAVRLSIGSTTVRTITGQEASNAQVSNELIDPEGYPSTIPEVHPANNTAPTICAVYRGPTEEAPAVTIEIFDTPPAALDPARSVQLRQTGDEVAAADLLAISPDQGILARQATVAGEDQPEDTVYLITSQGFKYRLGEGAQEALGYGGEDPVVPVPVPANLLALIPTGPLLDVASAQRGIDPAALP